MRVARRVLGMFAATVCFAAAAAAANAAILDFTDPAGGGNGSLNGNFDGTTYTLSTNGGTITFNPVEDGSTCAILVCSGDGLGIGDDEVSAVSVAAGEVLTITFGTALTIDKIFLLDLFTSTDGREAERATVAYDGGSVNINADPNETPTGDSGFRLFVFNTPIVTNFLQFSAPTIPGVNDSLGVNDYAVAGISAAPLPAALPIYLTGLGLMGLLGWFKRRRASAA
jgi:hypothetical protein